MITFALPQGKSMFNCFMIWKERNLLIFAEDIFVVYNTQYDYATSGMGHTQHALMEAVDRLGDYNICITDREFLTEKSSSMDTCLAVDFVGGYLADFG